MKTPSEMLEKKRAIKRTSIETLLASNLFVSLVCAKITISCSSF